MLSTGVGAMSKARITKMRRRMSAKVARVGHADFGPVLYTVYFGRELGSTDFLQCRAETTSKSDIEMSLSQLLLHRCSRISRGLVVSWTYISPGNETNDSWGNFFLIVVTTLQAGVQLCPS